MWAESLGVAADANLPPVADYSEPCARTAREVAIRAVVLQGVVAVAYKVEVDPVVQWFHAQGIWDALTPNERTFLATSEHSESEREHFQWKQEAQWTLLWMIGRVESLGLP